MMQNYSLIFFFLTLIINKMNSTTTTQQQLTQQQQMSEISIMNGDSSLCTADNSSNAKALIGESISIADISNKAKALLEIVIILLNGIDELRKKSFQDILEKLKKDSSSYILKTCMKDFIKKLTASKNTSKDESKKEELEKLLKDAQIILDLCDSKDKANSITAKASKAAVTEASKAAVTPASKAAVTQASKAAVTQASKAAVPKVNTTSVKTSKVTKASKTQNKSNIAKKPLELPFHEEIVNLLGSGIIHVSSLTFEQCIIVQQKLRQKEITEIPTIEEIEAAFEQIKSLRLKALTDSKESIRLTLDFFDSLPKVLELISNSTGSIISLFNELMELTKDCDKMKKIIISFFKDLKIYIDPNEESIKDESDSDDSDSDDSDSDDSDSDEETTSSKKISGEHSTFDNQDNELSKDKKDLIQKRFLIFSKYFIDNKIEIFNYILRYNPWFISRLDLYRVIFDYVISNFISKNIIDKDYLKSFFNEENWFCLLLKGLVFDNKDIYRLIISFELTIRSRDSKYYTLFREIFLILIPNLISIFDEQNIVQQGLGQWIHDAGNLNKIDKVLFGESVSLEKDKKKFLFNSVYAYIPLDLYDEDINDPDDFNEFGDDDSDSDDSDDSDSSDSDSSDSDSEEEEETKPKISTKIGGSSKHLE